MSASVPTKAEALRRAAAILPAGSVPPFVYWTVTAWRTRRGALVAACLARLGDARLAVRSATRDEDAPDGGLAGHYRTELDVAPTPDALARAVDRVVAAYPDDGRIHHVLVQAMVRDARRAGAVTTRDAETGAPYDVIELADGPATDVVTSGRAAATRIAVRHGADAAAVVRAGCATLLGVAHAVERGFAADRGVEIEVAERLDGTIAVLQVRRLGRARTDDRRGDRALARLAEAVRRFGRPRAGVAGRATVFGLMPDWNPAELIGAHPSPLAASLFRALVSDRTWQEARATMGYQAVPRTPLVRMLAGRPYVDVRASFNSLVPAGLPFATRARLVDAWLDRLRSAPELHDRVELEIADTVADLAAPDARRTPGGRVLRPDDERAWRRALGALTARAVDAASGSSLATALRRVAAPTVPRVGARVTDLRDVLAALAECRAAGAHPFAIVARHAFMAERMLRSLVERGALAPERLDAFRRSLATVAGRLAADWSRVARGASSLARFIARYGHLRPGAFDVASLPYARRDPEVWRTAPTLPRPPVPFVPRAAELTAIDRLVVERGIGGDARTLLAWARAAIVGREDAKFHFTRRLSTALEDVVAWGRARELEREELALLSLGDLRRAAEEPVADVVRLRARIDAARVRRVREREIRLGPLVRDAADLAIVVEPGGLPTFVGARTIVAAPAALDAGTLGRRGLAGRIVCVESADPGFDWIFGCGIAGLVTRFGGANSHMAVRCRELEVPAALGVGGPAFERVAAAAAVELCCGDRALRVVGVASHPDAPPVAWCGL